MTGERLASLRALLDALACPAMVVGGLAVAARGEPRFTRDADVTIVVPDAALPGVVSRAADAGFRALAGDPVAFARSHGVIPCERIADGWRVDLILAMSPYEEAAVARATLERAEDVLLPIATAEDLVVLKLLAGRPQDLDDVRSVVARAGAALDRTAIRLVLDEVAAATGDDALRVRTDELLG